MPTAAVVIIGNEILSGKFPDENGPFFIRRLREMGIDLLRLVVIPDDSETIAREVRDCSDNHDLVFTSGGVGPTHDDITLGSIAQAFDLPLELVPELEAILRTRWPEGPPEAALRMARLPVTSELIWDGALRFPLVRVRNVHILPGVPFLLQKKFDAAAHRWSGPPFLTERIHLERREVEIAPVLSAAQEQWPQVAIGSYPRHQDGEWSVLVTLEGREADSLAAAHDWLVEHLVNPGESPPTPGI
jgi:molybdenum cofactor synthesis domain-containing protein